MSSKLLVYGATGFVGGHIVRTAVGSGLPTILAGRDAGKLDPLAAELGAERRAFGLADPSAIETALKGVTVVLNCAGPFKRTAEPLAGACISAGVSYLDITGEIPVFEALHAKDAEAKARGVMLLPGVGFDVAATDCLALHLKRRLPSATRLRLAFQSIGPAGLPPGTQRTAIELMNYGDRVRRNGRLVRADRRPAISVDFGQGLVEAAPNSVGRRVYRLFQHRNSQHRSLYRRPAAAPAPARLRASYRAGGGMGAGAQSAADGRPARPNPGVARQDFDPCLGGGRGRRGPQRDRQVAWAGGRRRLDDGGRARGGAEGAEWPRASGISDACVGLRAGFRAGGRRGHARGRRLTGRRRAASLFGWRAYFMNT